MWGELWEEMSDHLQAAGIQRDREEVLQARYQGV